MRASLTPIRTIVVITPVLAGLFVGWLLSGVLPFELADGNLGIGLGCLGFALGLSLGFWTQAETVGLDSKLSQDKKRTAAHGYPFKIAKIYFYFSLISTALVTAVCYVEHRTLSEILVSGVLTYLLSAPPALVIYLALRRTLRPVAEGIPGADPIVGDRQTLRMRLIFAVQVPVITCAAGLVLVEHQSNMGYAAEIRHYHEAQRTHVQRQIIQLQQFSQTVKSQAEVTPVFLGPNPLSETIDWFALLILGLFVLLSSLFGRWLTSDVTGDLRSIEDVIRRLPQTRDQLDRSGIGLRETAALAQALEGAVDSFERQSNLIQEAAEERRRAEAEKATFLAHVSHELKSPLNSILGFSEILLAELDGPIDDEQRQRIGRVWRRGDRLLRYILGLLDVARLDGFRTSNEEAVDTGSMTRVTTGAALLKALRDQRRVDPLERIEVALSCDPRAEIATTRMEAVQTARALLLIAGTLTDALGSGRVNLDVTTSIDGMLTVVVSVDRGSLAESAQRTLLKVWAPLLSHARTGPTIETDAIAVRLLQLLEDVHGGEVFVEAHGNSPKLTLVCSAT